MSLAWNTNNYSQRWFGLAMNTDGTKIIASDNTGGIWQSLNAGTTFTQIYSGATNWISCTSSGSGTVLAAVTRGTLSPANTGTIYVSVNSGVTWTLYNGVTIAGNTQPYQYISCNSSSGQYMVAVHNNGPVIYSTNTGSTWTRASTFTGCMASAVNAAGDTMYVLALNNQVYKSTNSGSTWSTMTSVPGATGGCFSIACSSSGSVVWVASGSGVYYSTDSASTWNNVTPTGASPNYVNIACSSDGVSNVIVANSSGLQNINITTNSGTTWVAQSNLPSSQAWYNVASNSDGTRLVATAGNNGNTASLIYTNVYICFKEGSTILCLVDGKETYLLVQDIRKGVLVKTSASGYLPVTMIGSAQIFNPNNDLRYNNRLFRLSKENYPDLTEDLVLTGGHAILVDSLTDKQKEESIKENGKIMITENKYRLQTSHDERAIPYEESGLFNVWHFSLENAEYGWNYGVYANGGLLVETASEVVMKERSGLVLIE